MVNGIVQTGLSLSLGLGAHHQGQQTNGEHERAHGVIFLEDTSRTRLFLYRLHQGTKSPVEWLDGAEISQDFNEDVLNPWD